MEIFLQKITQKTTPGVSAFETFSGFKIAPTEAIPVLL